MAFRHAPQRTCLHTWDQKFFARQCSSFMLIPMSEIVNYYIYPRKSYGFTKKALAQRKITEKK